MSVKSISTAAAGAGKPGAASGRIASLVPGILVCLAVTAVALAVQAMEERATGHPYVEVDGVVVRDRAPMCRRLSVEELKIKSELSRLLWPDRYKKGR